MLRHFWIGFNCILVFFGALVSMQFQKESLFLNRFPEHFVQGITLKVMSGNTFDV